MEIKNLQIGQKCKEILSSTKKTIAAGAVAGMAIANGVNTLQPNLIPTLGGYIAGRNPNLNLAESLAVIVGLSSKQADIISPYAINITGAGLGIFLTSGFTIVKTAIKNHKKKQEEKEEEFLTLSK